MTYLRFEEGKKILGKAQLIKLNEAFELALRQFLYNLSPILLVQYLNLQFRRRLFYPRRAKTFEEKLLWLMLYWRSSLKSRCTDKYAVRSYVADHGFSHLLPKLYAVFATSDDIDFVSLPERFVLKCTHGSGFNLICRDKLRFDIIAAKKQLDQWMKVHLSKLAGEVHYAAIKPRIICEELLGVPSASSIDDYKVHCFGGRPHCTLICSGRYKGKPKFDYYDLDWKNKLAYCKSSLLAGRNIPRPDSYEEILEAARKLSAPFPFVRVDFYSVNGRAVFGEMTFTPNGCFDIDLTDLAQITMGDLIVLPAKRLL